jgi:hypothetical protein
LPSTYERLLAATERGRARFPDLPIVRRALCGEVDRTEYVRFLTQAWHHVRHTVPLMMGMGYHLPDRLRWLQPSIAHYIAEEMGHDEWILADIQAAGGDPVRARTSSPLTATELMVAYAHDTVRRRNPIGFLGMVFVLEGASVAFATRVADVLQVTLGLPASAFTYLRSHGVLDTGHIAFFAGLVERLTDPYDQEVVVAAATRFQDLYGAIFCALDTATEASPCSTLIA